MRLAILLHGDIKNDYRVLKTIKTLSREHKVDLFYIGNPSLLKELQSKNIKTFPLSSKNSITTKVLRHSFFCYEFNFFINYVKNQSIKYDYIWANDLPTLYPAYIISKRLRAKLIFDSHEIYTETINQFFPRDKKGLKGFITKMLIKSMRWHGRQVEKKIFPKIDEFITVNESLLNYFKKRYAIKNSTIIMNLPNLNDYNSANKKVDFRNKFNWQENSLILIYQGALNEGRGLNLIIQTIKNLDDRFKLIILGNGTLKDDLVQLSQDLDLSDRIKFFDAVNLKELPSHTKGADIGINLLEPFNLSKKLASPNKLFEYIHTGIPIVASDTIENRKVIEKFSIGMCCYNNIDEISKAVLDVSEKDYKTNLNVAKEKFSWELQESKLLRIIN
jgi:glycosyltransferase involved in cell wall biosynthesis